MNRIATELNRRDLLLLWSVGFAYAFVLAVFVRFALIPFLPHLHWGHGLWLSPTFLAITLERWKNTIRSARPAGRPGSCAPGSVPAGIASLFCALYPDRGR